MAKTPVPPNAQQATRSVSGHETLDIGQNLSITIGGDRTESVGRNSAISVGKKLLIEAADEVTLKVGLASLVMKKDGSIVLSGKNISINGSGKINVKASSDLVLKGSKILDN